MRTHELLYCVLNLWQINFIWFDLILPPREVLPVVYHPKSTTSILPTCLQNLKTLASANPEIWRKTQNVKIEVMWGWLGLLKVVGNVMIWVIAYYDSYSHFVETVSTFYCFRDIASNLSRRAGNVPTHEFTAPAAGECACPAHTDNACIRRSEGWQYKTAMRPLVELLRTLAVVVFS